MIVLFIEFWWFSFSDSCKHAHEMKWVKKTSKYFSFKWLSYFGCSVLLLFQCLILVIEQQYVHSRENSAEKGYLISCFNKFDQ